MNSTLSAAADPGTKNRIPRNDIIVKQVTIQAPASRIFKALTDPAELLKWWGTEGKFQAAEVESDLRPGGKWRMRVNGSCGSDTSSTVSGIYREVDPPRLLVFTWNREHEDWPETLVRWDLEENNSLTTVRVTHSGLTTEGLRQRNSGWPLIVSLLHAYIDSQS
jgi:uncharacterized protein YndB with AHSA1/START domain